MGLFNSIRMGSSAAGDYEVERSLRFNDNDTAYLSRNFGTGGNRKKWTFSAWIKRGNLGGTAGEMRIFGGSTNASHIFFASNDELTWDIAAPGSSASANLNTTQVFRDVSAWFHLVCALDTDNSTADNRMRIYINGTEVTSFGTRTNPSSGYASNAINADAFADGDRSLHTIGYRTSVQGSAGMEFDGYMAEINFIDGQQYDPSYFGETDAITGQWNPKKYVGSYGTTGFYLPLSDNSGTTATTLGKDTSGNGNNFTPNNFATTDSVKDTPNKNFCTLNPLNATNDTSLREGNLEFYQSSNDESATATFAITSGKWYWEVYKNSSENPELGIETLLRVLSDKTDDVSNTKVTFRTNGGDQQNGAGSAISLTGSSSGQTGAGVIAIAVDFDNKKIWYSDLSGNFFNSGNPATGSNAALDFSSVAVADGCVPYFFLPTGVGSFNVNFGQDPTFANHTTAGGNADGNGHGNFKYSVPSGYLALCSANLSDPTIKLPNKHFDTLLYSGTGSSNSITGLNFAPDLVWVKRRNATNYHILANTLSGAGNYLVSNNSDAESDGGSQLINGFNSDGFDVGTENAVNNSSGTYVAWNWNAGGSTVTNDDGSVDSEVRANTSAGFSIVTFSGSGNRTIGHGLGVAPQVIIMKGRNVTDQWTVGHQHLDASNPWHKGIPLNTTASTQDNATFWNDTAPTSTVFHKGTWNDGYNMVAYCFSEVAGYSKFGKYTGNGNANGTFVFTGFSPALIITKRSGGTGNWYMWDPTREGNVMNSPLQANDAGSEPASYDNSLDILSNGFKLRATNAGTNGSNESYLYMAFAESPFKNSRAR